MRGAVLVSAQASRVMAKDCVVDFVQANIAQLWMIYDENERL